MLNLDNPKEEFTMKAAGLLGFGIVVGLLASCGPTPQEQATMDAQRCMGFGFTPQTTPFANCMMGLSSQRDAQAAADQRAAAARTAADQPARDAQRAAKDRADQAAWDARTGHAPAQPDIKPADLKCKTTSSTTTTGNTSTTTTKSYCHN